MAINTDISKAPTWRDRLVAIDIDSGLGVISKPPSWSWSGFLILVVTTEVGLDGAIANLQPELIRRM